MGYDIRNHAALLCAMRGDAPPKFPLAGARVDFRRPNPELLRPNVSIASETLARERLFGADPVAGRVHREISRQVRQALADLVIEHIHSRTHTPSDSVEFYTNVLVHKGVTPEGTTFVTLEFIE